VTALPDTDHNESGLRKALRRFVEEEHYRGFAAMRPGQPAEQTVWTGTARQFGDYIVKLYADGLIDASSQRQAIFKAADRYVLKNGKALNPRAIYNSLATRQNLEGKPSDIRIGKPPNKR
jgi:hypothetical protein